MGRALPDTGMPRRAEVSLCAAVVGSGRGLKPAQLTSVYESPQSFLDLARVLLVQVCYRSSVSRLGSEQWAARWRCQGRIDQWDAVR